MAGIALVWDAETVPAIIAASYLAIPAIGLYAWRRARGSARWSAAAVAVVAEAGVAALLLGPGIVSWLQGNDPGIPVGEFLILLAVTVAMSVFFGIVLYELATSRRGCVE